MPHVEGGKTGELAGAGSTVPVGAVLHRCLCNPLTYLLLARRCRVGERPQLTCMRCSQGMPSQGCRHLHVDGAERQDQAMEARPNQPEGTTNRRAFLGKRLAGGAGTRGAGLPVNR